MLFDFETLNSKLTRNKKQDSKFQNPAFLKDSIFSPNKRSQQPIAKTSKTQFIKHKKQHVHEPNKQNLTTQNSRISQRGNRKMRNLTNIRSGVG